MKRQKYHVTRDGKLIETRYAWNAALRAMQDYVRDRANLERQDYTRFSAEGGRVNDFTKGVFTWVGSKHSDVLIIEITKEVGKE